MKNKKNTTRKRRGKSLLFASSRKRASKHLLAFGSIIVPPGLHDFVLLHQGNVLRGKVLEDADKGRASTCKQALMRSTVRSSLCIKSLLRGFCTQELHSLSKGSVLHVVTVDRCLENCQTSEDDHRRGILPS